MKGTSPPTRVFRALPLSTNRTPLSKVLQFVTSLIAVLMVDTTFCVFKSTRHLRYEVDVSTITELESNPQLDSSFTLQAFTMLSPGDASDVARSQQRCKENKESGRN